MKKNHEKDEPLSFIMFQNDKDKETQPDFTGKFITEDGRVMRIAGWKKEYKDKDGNDKTLIGGKVSEFQKASDNPENRKPAPSSSTNNAQEDADSLPF